MQSSETKMFESSHKIGEWTITRQLFRQEGSDYLTEKCTLTTSRTVELSPPEPKPGGRFVNELPMIPASLSRAVERANRDRSGLLEPYPLFRARCERGRLASLEAYDPESDPYALA